VARGGDAGSPVDVDPDVSLVGHRRLAGVQSHAHADRPVGECLAGRCRRRQRVGCLRERDEERVSLRAHLDAAIAGEFLPQRATVLGQHVRVAVAERLQKPRRAPDVGKQKRDGALWKRHVRAHALDHSG
jgi:hypothetical protein